MVSIVNEPLVTVAIPHHRGWRHLQTLLPSLARLDASGPTARVVVVDNASDDESRTFLRDCHPWVQILELPENRFFAGALNEAARRATTPWIAFLNNDMRVEPGWLREAFCIAERSACDCVASHILDWAGGRTQFCGGSINLEGKGFEWTERNADPNRERALLFACGGAMLVRRDLFLETGGFDEAFEMIYEDVDFGWRLNLMGKDVRYAPKSIVCHRAHASLRELDYSTKAVYFERNSLGMLYKNLEESALVRLLPGLGGRGVTRARALAAVECDGHATLDGLSAFWRCLPYWRERRREVQAQRRRRDNEIPGLFSSFLTADWGYTPAHRERVGDCRPSLDSLRDAFSGGRGA